MPPYTYVRTHLHTHSVRTFWLLDIVEDISFEFLQRSFQSLGRCHQIWPASSPASLSLWKLPNNNSENCSDEKFFFKIQRIDKHEGQTRKKLEFFVGSLIGLPIRGKLLYNIWRRNSLRTWFGLQQISHRVFGFALAPFAVYKLVMETPPSGVVRRA